MTRSFTMMTLLFAGIVATLGPAAVMAAQDVPLDFPVTTLRAENTWVGLREVETENQQSGNPKYISIDSKEEGKITSRGAPESWDTDKNELNLLRQDLQAIETSADNKHSRIGSLLALPEHGACEATRIGAASALFNVTGNNGGMLRVDCLGGDTLQLRGMGAKCLSTWLPEFDIIRVQGKAHQEIIFSPTQDDTVPSLIAVEYDFFSIPSDTSLVLEMPRLVGSNYTVTVTGQLPFGTTDQEPGVVIRGCNVGGLVNCQVMDAGMSPKKACKFEDVCVNTKEDAVTWIDQRRQQGDCPSVAL